MNARTIVVLSVLALATWLTAPRGSAQDKSAGKAAAAADKPLDPRGRADEKFIKVPVRYYVWHDAEGWHLRTASQKDQVRKFHGKIKLVGGTFNKLREIGLERKGKSADNSKVNAARTEIEFTIFTSGSFDGYDFTINGGKDARVEFALQRGGKERPDEIFVGGKGQHPDSGKFDFPATPTAPAAD